MKRIAVIRVRGSPKTHRKKEETMKMLHLMKVNHCSIITDSPQYKGMLQKVKDHITWGEISEEEITQLLKKRGRITGNKKLTDEYMKKQTKYESIEKFVKAYAQGKAELKDIPGIKPYFRLNPPKGGYKQIKKQYPNKGTLGNRGAAMDKLIEKMIR